MKKLFYLFAFTALITVLMVSCKEQDNATGIELDKDTLKLAMGGTTTLTANLLPYTVTGKVNWTTNNSSLVTLESDNAVAVMSKCVVTAKAAGTATITAATSSGKYSATCTIEIINAEPELIAVEGGTFTMGCTDNEGFGIEFPEHSVTLSSFKIAKFPVTQDQWEVVMGNSPSYFKGDRLPVECVSWNAAQTFINKLNALTGKNYRFPTEAEWEYAARGGNKSKGSKYSGGNDINAVAWYLDNNTGTQPVGTKASNELGIYDMSGNVWEWCSDWYDIYTNDHQIDPKGPKDPPETGAYHILRGGSWANDPIYCRVSSRAGLPPGEYSYVTGLRLVLP